MGSPTIYEWEWRLRSKASDLWPHVANTERFNKVIGLPEPVFRDVAHEGGGTRRIGEAQQVGLTLRWNEHPYEWIAPQWLGVLREYDSGPVRSVRTSVRLVDAAGGGTLLSYRIEVQASGLMGRMVQGFEFTRMQGAMERAFQRIDAKVQEAADSAPWHLNLDAFEAPTDHLDHRGARRMQEALGKLRAWRLPSSESVDRLAQLVQFGADHAVERIRPLRLAHDWGLPPEHAIDVCLVAAHVGLLDVAWSVLCPACRSPAADSPKLARLAPTTHCDACNIDFETEFVESVELGFKPAASIRPVTPGSYCLGGPAHKPTAVCQLWLQPGEARQFTLDLGHGSWRASGPRAHGQAYLDAGAVAGLSAPQPEQAPGDAEAGPAEPGADEAVELLVDGSGALHGQGQARSGANTIRMRNDSQWDQVLRIERANWRDDAVTAAQVMTHATFRQLFSADVLTPGTHVDVGHVAILFTDLKGSTALYEEVGDASAYAMVRRHFEVLEEMIAAHSGTIVKTIGDAVMGAWHDPLNALVAAISLQTALSEHVDTAHLQIKVGVHWGRCIGVTVNGTFDYFGTTVNTAARLERVAGAGEVAISEALAAEPTVSDWLDAHPRCVLRTEEQTLKGLVGTHTCLVLCGDALRSNLRKTESLDIADVRRMVAGTAS